MSADETRQISASHRPPNMIGRRPPAAEHDRLPLTACNAGRTRQANPKTSQPHDRANDRRWRHFCYKISPSRFENPSYILNVSLRQQEEMTEPWLSHSQAGSTSKQEMGSGCHQFGFQGRMCLCSACWFAPKTVQKLPASHPSLLSTWPRPA